jgi:hypothetical protein
MRYIVPVAALAVAVSAQSSTQIYIIAAGPTQVALQGVVGSIVGVSPEATTVAIACASGATNCPFKQAFTITEGPSTYSVSAAFTTSSDGAEVMATIEEDCKMSATTSVSCSASIGVEISISGYSTTSNVIIQTAVPSEQVNTETLLITGGIEKLSAPTATSTPSPTPKPGAAAGRAAMGGAAAAAAAVAAAAVGML